MSSVDIQTYIVWVFEEILLTGDRHYRCQQCKKLTPRVETENVPTYRIVNQSCIWCGYRHN